MTCNICGARLAESFAGKAAHMHLYHNVQKSKRTKKEIVASVERRLHRFLIDGGKCEEACRCAKCFQKALDAFVALTEVNLNAMGNALSKHDDLSSDEL